MLGSADITKMTPLALFRFWESDFSSSPAGHNDVFMATIFQTVDFTQANEQQARDRCTKLCSENDAILPSFASFIGFSCMLIIASEFSDLDDLNAGSIYCGWLQTRRLGIVILVITCS